MQSVMQKPNARLLKMQTLPRRLRRRQEGKVVTNTPSKRMVRLTMQSVMQKPMLMMTDQRIPWTPVEVVEAAAAVEIVVAEAAAVTVVEAAVAEMVKGTESTAVVEVE